MRNSSDTSPLMAMVVGVKFLRKLVINSILLLLLLLYNDYFITILTIFFPDIYDFRASKVWEELSLEMD